jgi:hypothetical protein
MARISVSEWAQIKGKVLSPFKLKYGRWHQERLKREIELQRFRKQECSNAGKIGMKNRWGTQSKHNECYDPVITDCNSSSSSSSSTSTSTSTSTPNTQEVIDNSSGILTVSNGVEIPDDNASSNPLPSVRTSLEKVTLANGASASVNITLEESKNNTSNTNHLGFNSISAAPNARKESLMRRQSEAWTNLFYRHLEAKIGSKPMSFDARVAKRFFEKCVGAVTVKEMMHRIENFFNSTDEFTAETRGFCVEEFIRRFDLLKNGPIGKTQKGAKTYVIDPERLAKYPKHTR